MKILRTLLAVVGSLLLIGGPLSLLVGVAQTISLNVENGVHIGQAVLSSMAGSLLAAFLSVGFGASFVLLASIDRRVAAHERSN